MRKHDVIDLELIRKLIQFSCNATYICNWNSQSYAYSVYGIYTKTINFFQTCFPDTRAPENFLLNLSSYHISKYPNQLVKSSCVSKAGLSRTTLEDYSRFSAKDFLDNLFLLQNSFEPSSGSFFTCFRGNTFLQLIVPGGWMGGCGALLRK